MCDLIHISILPTYTITDATGKRWLFDWHWYCGPTVLRKDGEPRKNWLREDHPFWDALQAWIDGGKRVDEKGECVLGKKSRSAK